jgi:hypothetical protein
MCIDSATDSLKFGWFSTPPQLDAECLWMNVKDTRTLLGNYKNSCTAQTNSQMPTQENPVFVTENPVFITENPAFITENPAFIRGNFVFNADNPFFITGNPAFITRTLQITHLIFQEMNL